MSNGRMLDELRDLAKEDKIGAYNFRRLSLAATADMYECLHGKDGLVERVGKTEKKITYLARAELIVTGVFGIILAKIKGA